MEKIKKLFGGTKMTWPRVIIFAIITGTITALLNEIPALKDTSFQDIAISYECWILFAVFIIVNCEKWWEASLKTFVFFLISQPLVYLIEVLFGLTWDKVFMYYRFWFIMTVLTIPGAVIAFFVKKKNWLSVAVLSVANAFLAYLGVGYFKSAFAKFPNHLLSAIFCIALAVFFSIILFDEKRHRIAALAIVAAAIVASAFIVNATSNPSYLESDLGEGTWTFEQEYGEDVVSVSMIDGDTAAFDAISDGYATVRFSNDSGEATDCYVTVYGGGIMLNFLDAEESTAEPISAADAVSAANAA